MILSEIVSVLESIAPPRLAQVWDNVGLIVGDRQQQISHAMFCIDYTTAVADEARAAAVNLVVAYHPPVFKPLKQLTADGPAQLVYEAVRRGVAIYSPHTALDVASGGTNDVLADVIGLTERRPLEIIPGHSTELKLVTFVPADHVDAVAKAMFNAGAGRIGNYSSCSFRVAGTGTFFGEAGTSPATGTAGRLETVNEIQLETVLPADRLAAVVAALRAAHPYELPAFDAIPLAAPPEEIGLGRIGQLKSNVDRAAIIELVKERLSLSHVLVAGPTSGPARIAAVCAGSCGDVIDRAISGGADVYLTGELKHHDALRAAAAGMMVICTLHSHSERITLATVARKLREQCPTVRWSLSQADRDPFSVR